ncbi:hypothetical protein DP939_32675 [Spongiactinospora rosea]|uniref:Uncharacterized protein n=1 Tax=Spongiactinospora rosea TaxID=2248750 RepID=A0A366LS89_9ACTN|nr:hypothetical protein [Spongiactinospora rosea]RBQ16062.1 hypothetical protein DP939_32675 [Spongiactinospora rosea]
MTREWCNPFHPTGEAGSARDAPLRIWQMQVRKDLFIFLDDTRRQYLRFTEMLKERDRRPLRGQVVYVAGRAGAGKTSFIEHCVYHILRNPPQESDDRGELTDSAVRTVDLSGSPVPSDHSEAALTAFCQDVYNDTLAQVAVDDNGLWLSDDEWSELEGHTFKNGFFKLRSTLQKRAAVVVVILPPQIPLVWVKEFVAAAWPRVTFLIEGDDITKPTFDSVVGTAQNRTTFFARVGLLQDGDVAEFVRSRWERTDLPHGFPDIPAPTLNYIIKNMSYMPEPVIRVFDNLFKILIDTAIEENVEKVDEAFFHRVLYKRIISWNHLVRTPREDEA